MPRWLLSDGDHGDRRSPAAAPDPHSSTPDRVVRVFISSTFRDMFEEREILVKHIFPGLRRPRESDSSPSAESGCDFGLLLRRISIETKGA